jgi:hypothetical protein
MESLIGERQRELLALARHTTYNSCPEGSVPGNGLHFIYYEDYRSLDGGRFTGALSKPVTFFEEVVADTGSFHVSFWYEGATRDLWPRTVLRAELFGADGTEYLYLEDHFFRNMVMRNGSWGLVEFTVQVREPSSTLRLAMVNKYVTKGEMVLDRVLVLPHGSVHLAEEGNRLWINNRPLAECLKNL